MEHSPDLNLSLFCLNNCCSFLIYYYIECDISKNFTAQNAVNHEIPKKKRSQAKKAKIPQKLVENRKQEIITSLDKVSDMDESVVKGIPRVSTGSKRGSNFRGVSVNGKKWQVSLQLPSIYVQFIL